MPSEEVSNLKRSRILCIRAMDRILANRRRKLLANCSLFRLCRIRRAHQLTQIGNGIVFLEHHREDRPARHELRKLAKERTRRMNVVKALGLSLGDGNLLNGNDLESRLFNLGKNCACMALADGVRLDDAECAL